MLEKILVPSDLSSRSNSVIPYAATLAQTFQSKIYLVHVMDPADLHKPERLGDFPRLGKFFATDRDAADLPPLSPSVAVGKFYRYDDDPAEVILRFAAKRNVNLICMAATHQGRELAHLDSKQTNVLLFAQSGNQVKNLMPSSPTRQPI